MRGRIAGMNSPLWQVIFDAFPDAEPPHRPVTFHRCEECNQVDELLGNRVWSDVASDFPPYCHDTFPLLTPVAQAYYVPAYMLAALGPESGMQGISLEAALQGSDLSPDKFTAEQRAGIAHWIESYWTLDGSGPLPEGLSRWAS